MCFISVPSVKEIHPGQGCFSWLKVVVVNRCEEEEKREENWAIFRKAYLTNYLSDFFKFGMLSCVYGGHKIYEFNRNPFSSYRDMRC